MEPDRCGPIVIRRVFFDAAGTLIDLAEPVGRVYARLASRHGVRAEADQLQSAFARAWRATPPPLHPEDKPSGDDDRSWWLGVVRRTFEQVLPQPLPKTALQALFEDLYRHFAQPEAWRLFDDVMPALDLLRGRFDLHVLSNFDRRLGGILRGLGIADRFQSMTLSSVVGASKPHPRLFSQALAAARGDAATSLHVGDETEADIEGAAAAGFHAWHVKRPGACLMTLAEKLMNREHSCLQASSQGVCILPPKTERG